MTLEQQLGYEQGTKLLIVNADDFGMCHSYNLAAGQLLQEGAVSSATVMIPCGWAKEAADLGANHPGYDIGIHLTFTSEWSPYKWGPVTRNGDVHMLVTKEGYFPADVATFEKQASRQQVRMEIISQIEMALSLGLKPTHLDNHMGSLYGLATGRHFLDMTIEICARYGLAFRIPRAVPAVGRLRERREVIDLAARITELADRLGVVILDELIALSFSKLEGETYESYKRDMIGVLRDLQPGVSEVAIHPGFATEELKAIHGEWEKRQWDFRLFRDSDVKNAIKEEGIVMIRWRDLQNLQRKNR